MPLPTHQSAPPNPNNTTTCLEPRPSTSSLGPLSCPIVGLSCSLSYGSTSSWCSHLCLHEPWVQPASCSQSFFYFFRFWVIPSGTQELLLTLCHVPRATREGRRVESTWSHENSVGTAPKGEGEAGGAGQEEGEMREAGREEVKRKEQAEKGVKGRNGPGAERGREE